MYTLTHMYLFTIFKFLLEARSCYVAQATWDLCFSSASWVHTLPHLALKLILINIIWRSTALFSRLGSRGASPTANTENWWRNSNFESTVLGHSDKAKSNRNNHHAASPPSNPDSLQRKLSGTSRGFFIIRRIGPREARSDLASTGTARLGRKRRQLMPAKADSAP